jgi:hypothetical protein
MKRASRSKNTLAMSVLAFAALVVTGRAHAQSIPAPERMAASAGSARLGNERPCLRYDWGKVWNTCWNPVIYTITPRVHPGSNPLRYAANGSGVTCKVMRINAFGDPDVISEPVTLNGSTYVGQLYIGPSYNMAMIYECTFPADERAWLGSVSH